MQHRVVKRVGRRAPAWHGLAVGLALGLTALSGPVVALAGAAPTGPLVLVVSGADRIARAELIRAAGGVPVGPADAPLAGFARFQGTGFAPRLRAAGAWAVLDGARLAAICGIAA